MSRERKAKRGAHKIRDITVLWWYTGQNRYTVHISFNRKNGHFYPSVGADSSLVTAFRKAKHKFLLAHDETYRKVHERMFPPDTSPWEKFSRGIAENLRMSGILPKVSAEGHSEMGGFLVPEELPAKLKERDDNV